MIKKVIFVILILVFVILDITEKEKGAPDLYFMDIENNRIRMVGDRSYIIYDVIWSGDSKYFMFDSDAGNYYSDTSGEETKLSSSTNLKVVEIPEDIFIESFKYMRVFWIDKDHNLSDKPGNNESDTATFSKKSGEEKNIFINEAALEKVEKVIGTANTDYFEAYISNDGNHVLYRAEDYKVYYLDLTTGRKKWLFSGCGLNWSPNETKISYGVPHTQKIEDADDWESYDSDMLDSYVYDFNTGRSIKVADFGIQAFFSFDDKYMVFFESAVMGPRGGSQ